MTLSAIVLTKNNQTNLKKTLNSLSFADELIVIDDYSTDNTTEIASKKKAKIYKSHLNNDWSAQRNIGLTKATSDWVLFLDSDEIVSNSLKKEIKKAIKTNKNQGFYLKRTDIFLGKKLEFGETANVKLLRLAKKNSGHFVNKVHEIWKIKGKVATLKEPLLHNRDLNLTDFIERVNRYSDINTNSKFNYLDLLKPILKFLYNYFFLLGFLDGFRGLAMAYLMSLHSLSVRI